MKTRTMLSLGLAAVVALAIAGESADDPDPVLQELMRLEDGAMERWRQGDPMGWAEIAAPEVTYVDPGLTRPIVGHEAYTQYLEPLKGKISYGGSEYARPKAPVYGDVAVLTYNYRGTTRKPDGTVERYAPWNTTEVYARLEGEWKIIHTHWSYLEAQLPDRIEVPVPVEASPTAPAGVLAELLAVESATMERYRKGDATAFCAISVPAVTYFDPSTPRRLDGLVELKEHMTRQADPTRYHVVEILEPRAQVHGETAVLFYRFLVTTLRPDGSVAGRQAWNHTEVFIKKHGQWRIVHTHRSRIGGRPAPGSASEAG